MQFPSHPNVSVLFHWQLCCVGARLLRSFSKLLQFYIKNARARGVCCSGRCIIILSVTVYLNSSFFFSFLTKDRNEPTIHHDSRFGWSSIYKKNIYTFVSFHSNSRSRARAHINKWIIELSVESSSSSARLMRARAAYFLLHDVLLLFSVRILRIHNGWQMISLTMRSLHKKITTNRIETHCLCDSVVTLCISRRCTFCRFESFFFCINLLAGRARAYTFCLCLGTTWFDAVYSVTNHESKIVKTNSHSDARRSIDRLCTTLCLFLRIHSNIEYKKEIFTIDSRFISFDQVTAHAAPPIAQIKWIDPYIGHGTVHSIQFAKWKTQQKHNRNDSIDGAIVPVIRHTEQRTLSTRRHMQMPFSPCWIT